MKLTDILARLDGVTTDHDGHLTMCPAHKDVNTPSLKLTLKADGQLLVVCRAGCKTDDVLKKLNLSKSDLFDVDGQGVKTVPSAAPEAVGVAEIAGLRMFVDGAAGQLQALPSAEEARKYMADRFGLTPELAEDLGVGYSGAIDRPQAWLSKSFTRHPRLTVPFAGFDGVVRGLQGRDISGRCPARWVGLANVDGRTWAKYGVLRSGAGFDTVLVCEGPGDALSAVGAGYDAVAIRGAGLARNAALVAELATGLAGLDVVMCGDRDNGGRGFNTELAGALVRAGVMVRRLEIPHDGDDLTDWRARDAEGFPAALHAAVRAAQVVVLDAPAPATVPAVDPEVSATDAALATMGLSARQAFDVTDVGIAVRLRDYLRRDGGGVRYAPGLGFLVWDGRVWAPGNAKVREALHLMGAELMASGDDDSRRLALKALTNRSIDAVIKELPSVPGVPADAREFDAHPELLSVNNGTINLRTGELHAHTPADMITKRLYHAYNPDAKASRWELFLQEVFPNHPELPGYMQRLVGYGATGSVAEECFAFLYGDGKNGKSKLLQALRHVFRGITKATEFSTFESRPAQGQAAPELAELRGARIVTASETEKYSRLAEGLIKQVTGDDPVTCRELYGHPFTYDPAYLIIVAGNYRPSILSQDYGIWRRVKLIPFEASFKGSKADTRLKEKLAAEADGILAWAVRGAVEWYTNGLQEPASIQAATQDYRESEDRLAEFIAARLIRGVGPEFRVAPMAVRRAYAEWADDAGLSRKEVLSGWALGVELESRGFTKRRVGGKWGFDGIRLATDSEQSAARSAAEMSPAEEPAGDAPTDIFGQPREEAAA